jgi:hypothetical protein
MTALRAKSWVQLVGIFVVGSLLAGCASMRVDWAGRVGHFSYDQAVLELGPPDKSATLKDGTVVSEWLTRRGYTWGYAQYGYYPWYYGPFYPGYTEMNSPDYFLRLTFGPDGTLKAWKHFYR